MYGCFAADQPDGFVDLGLPHACGPRAVPCVTAQDTHLEKCVVLRFARDTVRRYYSAVRCHAVDVGVAGGLAVRKRCCGTAPPACAELHGTVEQVPRRRCILFAKEVSRCERAGCRDQPGVGQAGPGLHAPKSTVDARITGWLCSCKRPARRHGAAADNDPWRSGGC